MTRAAAVIVVMALGSRVTCLRALKCLIRALALSAGALIELISSLRHLVSVGVRVLGRDLDADARFGVALVRQRGQPQRSRPVQRRQGVGASGDPVSADQGPVQADERLAVPAEPVQDVGDLGGPLGDHLQGLVQVAVAGGLPDPGVAGQGPHIGAVLEPPQHQDGLAPGRAGPLMRADVVGATVSGQPAADGAHSGDGDVESGTIGHPRGAFLAGRFSWSKTTLPHGSACPRSDTPHPTPPRPDLPFPAITTLTARAPSPPMRKPH